ncbi:MAG: hypothetical protein R3E14_02815 [Erythrobacter sp.]
MKIRAMLVGALALMLAPSLQAQDTQPSVDEQSRNFVQQFLDQYGDYTETYLQLFIAQTKCEYDFVDPETFNNLADDMLRQLSAELEPVVRSQQEAAGWPASDEWVEYASRLTALSAVDALATSRSAQIQAEIERIPDYCATLRNENEERYSELKAFMASRSAP